MVYSISTVKLFLEEETWCNELGNEDGVKCDSVVTRTHSVGSSLNLWGGNGESLLDEGALVDLAPPLSLAQEQEIADDESQKEIRKEASYASLTGWQLPRISNADLDSMLTSLSDVPEPEHLYTKGRIQQKFDSLMARHLCLHNHWDLRRMEEVLRHRGGISCLDLRQNRLFGREQLQSLARRLPKLSSVILSTFPGDLPMNGNEDKARDLYCLLGLRGCPSKIKTFKTGDLGVFGLVRFVKAHPEIERIEFMNCPELDDACLRVLGDTLTSLRWIRLSNCPKVTGDGVAELLGVQKVRVLELENMSQIDASALEKIADASRWLLGLLLKDGQELSAKALLTVLGNNRMLRVLDLRKSAGLCNSDMEKLGKLSGNLEVLGVTLVEGKLSGSGLNDFVRHSQFLKHLSVGVRHDTAKIFKQTRRLQVISTRPCLVSLHFEDVYHMDEEELLELVRETSQLRLLGLTTCGRWWNCDENGYLKILTGNAISKDEFPSLTIQSDIRTEVFSSVVEAELCHTLQKWDQNSDLSPQGSG